MSDQDLYDELNAGREKYLAIQAMFEAEDDAMKKNSKANNPFDYTKAIFDTNERFFDFRGYVPFVVNRHLSFSRRSVIMANEMNRSALPPEVQFEFLRSTVRKQRGFVKWYKRKEDDRIKLIMKVYKYSYDKAKEVVDLFTPEQLEILEKGLEKGGR